MNFIRLYILFSITVLIASCGFIPGLDEVATDRRQEYRKSEALPDLAIPPDLTLESDVDPLLIPNQEPATYSEYQRQRTLRESGAVGGAEFATINGEQVVVVTGDLEDIWPRLQRFWQENGYELDLNDPELGVMETQWRQASADSLSAIRHKFIVLAEPGTQGETTRLFISSEFEERLSSDDAEAAWLPVAKDRALERDVAALMSRYFSGDTGLAAVAGERDGSTIERARLQDISEEGLSMVMPDDYDTAWALTAEALKQSGYTVTDEDKESGVYNILYFQDEEEEGFFSRLKFWGDDDGTPYQLSLTPKGPQTEMFVLDETGDLAGRDEATRILSVLQAYYNSLRRR